MIYLYTKKNVFLVISNTTLNEDEDLLDYLVDDAGNFNNKLNCSK